jgi:type IV pilus assembly protein PilZ
MACRHDAPVSNTLRPESRDTERRAVELRVAYENMNSFFADYVKNLSRGGTFIVTETPFPIGTEFLFRLAVPRNDEALAVRGVVRWIHPKHQATADRPAGMGVEFVFTDSTEKLAFTNAVESWMRESFGPALTRALMDPEGSKAT